MNSSIFKAMGNTPFGNVQNIMNGVNQLKQTFSGNPQQTINQMLQSGKISQSQLDQAKRMAEQIQSMLR